jgi:4-amino-4-deoxy-L-arabinose transferase-like glycosyltransferase
MPELDVSTTDPDPSGGGGRPAGRWANLALPGVLLIAALLYGWAIGDRVLQPYYAAAVHSMSLSGKAFLFAGYDQAGVVTIDKPPLAFWVQTVFVRVFGYHWWAIALAQCVEGVTAVFLLHRVVRRWAGERVALLAALLPCSRCCWPGQAGPAGARCCRCCPCCSMACWSW